MAEVRDERTYYGRVWTEGTYDDRLRPSAVNMRVGEPGVKVATVLQYLRDLDGDADAVIKMWGGYLTRQDIEDARAYYESNEADKADIDERLAQASTTN